VLIDYYEDLEKWNMEYDKRQVEEKAHRDIHEAEGNDSQRKS